MCSALFDLNCIGVIHDASGCTGNYTGYDEPRWYGSRAAIFCSGLREIDAVLGDDEKLIQKILKAAESLKPDLIALIGSPVPMVIGADLKGIAADLEVRTGIPCFGFDTTGTKYYSNGVAQACTELVKRFTKQPDGKNPRGVNLLGVTPLDLDSAIVEDIKTVLAENELELIGSFCDGLTLQEIEDSAQASVNLVLSQSGIDTAQYMQRQFGIPYLVGLPIGGQAQAEWLKQITLCAQTQQPKILSPKGGEATVLVLGDEVFCRAWQLGLETEFGLTADCGCLFGTSSALGSENVLDLSSELKISRAVNSGKYQLIVGDPMLSELIRDKASVSFFDSPVYCVSSKMAQKKPVSLIGERFHEQVSAFFSKQAQNC